MDIYNILNNATYSDFKKWWQKHLLWSTENERISGNPKWWEEPQSLNLLGIRCNTEDDFNFGKYNDYLIVIFNKSIDEVTLTISEVTVDPFRNRDGIAHLRQGIWNSYVIRKHRGMDRFFPLIGLQGRWACCQDLGNVKIVRTDGNGKEISHEEGMFGINIHDNGGYSDTSLGCTIFRKDESYINNYLPFIFDIDKKRKVPINNQNISYCLINHTQLETYYGQSIGKVNI